MKTVLMAIAVIKDGERILLRNLTRPAISTANRGGCLVDGSKA